MLLRPKQSWYPGLQGLLHTKIAVHWAWTLPVEGATSQWFWSILSLTFVKPRDKQELPKTTLGKLLLSTHTSMRQSKRTPSSQENGNSHIQMHAFRVFASPLKQMVHTDTSIHRNINEHLTLKEDHVVLNQDWAPLALVLAFIHLGLSLDLTSPC